MAPGVGLAVVHALDRDLYATTSAACSLLIASGAQRGAALDMEAVANQENEFEAMQRLQTERRLERASGNRFFFGGGIYIFVHYSSICPSFLHTLA